MGAIDEDAVVHGVDEVGGFRGGTGGDFADGFHAVLLVAGIDALGTVAGVVVDIESEAREVLDYWKTLFLGDARIDSAFVNDYIALGNHLAHHFGGTDERPQVRTVVVVDGCGDGDNVYVAIFYFFQ